VDHRNGVRSDNRWDNLRDVTTATNMQNRRTANFNNASGLLGVSFDKRARKPFAQIMVSGKNIFLGWFDTSALAHAAYLKAKSIYHKDCYFLTQGDLARGRLVG